MLIHNGAKPKKGGNVKRVYLFAILVLFLSGILPAQGMKTIITRIEKLEGRVASLAKAGKPADNGEELLELQTELEQMALEIELLKAAEQSLPIDYKDEFAEIEKRINHLEESQKKLEPELTQAHEPAQPSKLHEVKDHFSLTYHLDMDVWADNHGNYFKNDYSKVYFNTEFSDKFSVHFGLFFHEGGIPAGGHEPDGHLFEPEYYGLWMKWKDAFNGVNLTLGDIHPKFGRFSYYCLKTKAMIMGTRYIRGVQINKDFEWAELDVYIGSENESNIFGTAVKLNVPITENHHFDVFTAFDFDQTENSRPFWSGIEFVGSMGILDIKADLGYAGVAENDDIENATSFLIEPAIALGENGSLCTSFFYQIDDSGVWEGAYDNMFFYIEPGYSINPKFALGLPIEYHEPDVDTDDDESIWLVPTAYIYPIEGVEIWAWGMMSQATAADSDPEFSIGLELILNSGH